ncbi:MAG: hypothetical protein J6W94_00380 [Bacteroidales bacterium]|nr:hypothetical protein [Bacteroidales bacterium]MBP5675453.1 hypothetical protein [Bacteroidales bacterium]
MKEATVRALSSLRSGETVPSSALPPEMLSEILSEGGVSSIVRGTRQSLRVVSRAAFDVFLRSKGLQPDTLGKTADLFAAPPVLRAQQVLLTGDSKATPVRSCPGFPVNVIGPLSVRLGERKLLLCPCPGSFLFISDFRNLRIPSNTIVVGVENMENFRFPERQTAVWDQILDQYGGDGVPPILLVSRYPQSKDLAAWLQEISNQYVHFGDFDLAGIHIFLTEFYRHLGERAAFFVPDDIEDRLALGSSERYSIQFARFGKMEVSDPRLDFLVQLIHRYQKGYDQEGYIVGEV